MIGISPEYEIGFCSICKKKKKVRIIADNSTKRIMKICERCANATDISVTDALERYGRKTKKRFEINKGLQYSVQ